MTTVQSIRALKHRKLVAPRHLNTQRGVHTKAVVTPECSSGVDKSDWTFYSVRTRCFVVSSYSMLAGTYVQQYTSLWYSAGVLSRRAFGSLIVHHR
ncbi:hypothetical protein MRB53_042110 [Persea americana]|nr:hypothetical protein MRB53_042110 [Persea americana]